MAKKITVPMLKSLKESGTKITMITSYDATFTRILDRAGVDVILVGDSLGMVIQGRKDTTHVTMEDMIYHAAIVARGVESSHLLVDMPFMSYQVSVEEAVRSAGRLVKEGGAESVKLEGGKEYAATIEAIHRAGIPVMAHIGLTPQSIHQLGGFRIQGRDPVSAQRLVDDAKIVEEAGAWGIVLEGIPREVAQSITQAVSIPTVGIGAGPDCDGQVLVIYDLLGMDNRFNPKFAKKYADLNTLIHRAVGEYVEEVRMGGFPTDAHTYR